MKRTSSLAIACHSAAHYSFVGEPSDLQSFNAFVSHYIRKALGVEFVERYEADPARLHSPRDVRGLLTDGIVLTEQTVEPLLKATEQEIQALSFAVRWGPRYDPEMILEHAVCHLLRHRRQLERW